MVIFPISRSLHISFYPPYIASFFRNIGLADKLGSGVRNIFKYAKYYQGGHPHFFEQDISVQVLSLKVRL